MWTDNEEHDDSKVSYDPDDASNNHDACASIKYQGREPGTDVIRVIDGSCRAVISWSDATGAKQKFLQASNCCIFHRDLEGMEDI